MVIAELKVECVEKVKGNRFYGGYEIKTEYTRTITEEKYDGLVCPKHGIAITIKNMDGVKVTFKLDSHYFTGELEKDIDEDTTFSTSFGFSGCIYEVEVDREGNLVSFDEYFSRGDFEDGNAPDNHYTANSKGIKWELINR
jgi:hypothetical protein